MGFLGFRAAFNFLHAAIGSGIVLLYPLYASAREMKKPLSRDLHQWLTYWVLLSFLTLFELYFSSIISWIPLWPYIKLVFCMWLVLPSFKGAAYVYDNVVIKFIKIESKERTKVDFEEEKEEDEDEEKEDDDEEKKIFQAWKLVDDYIDKYGADSVEKIVQSALQATGTNKQKEK